MRSAVVSLAFIALVPPAVLAQSQLPASGDAVFATTAPGKRTDARVAEISASVEEKNSCRQIF